MSRYVGIVLIALLVTVGYGLRAASRVRAEVLLDHESRARQTVIALYDASHDIVQSGRRHPGLAGILHVAPDLELIEQESRPDRGFAQDDSYMYGLTTTAVGSARPNYGFILRAWPRVFGRTGDREFHITDAGVLWIGLNERGRSGLRHGFPPPFPEPSLGERGSRWIPDAAGPQDGPPAQR